MKGFISFLLVLCLICLLQAIQIIVSEHSKSRSKTQENRLTRVYKGSMEVKLQDGNVTNMEYFVTFVPKTDLCYKAACHYGWIDNYTLNGEPVVQGYPSGKGILPVFKFDTDSETEYEIYRNPSLGDDFVKLIEISCDKLNPQILQKGALPNERDGSTFNPKYQFVEVSNPNVNPPPEMNLTNSDYYFHSEKNVSLEKVKATQSKITEDIGVDPNKTIKHRAMNYSFAIPTDNSTSSTSGDAVAEFMGNATTVWHLYVDGPITTYSEFKKVQSIVLKYTPKNCKGCMFTYEAITLAQQSTKNTAAPTKVVISPRAEASKVAPQNVSSLNINIGQKMGTITPSKPSSGSRSPVNQNGVINSTNATVVGTPTQDVIYNQTEQLFSQTILGQDYTLDLESYCVLTVTNYSNGFQNHSASCVAEVISTLGSNPSIIQIYDFTSQVQDSWSWDKNYAHNISDTIPVPLPPPISFITINFAFGLNFNFQIGLNATATLNDNGFNFSVVPYAEAGASITASVSVAVICVEGGVSVNGQLVNAEVQPEFTLAYIFREKEVVASLDWTATLSTAQLNLSIFMGVGIFSWWKTWNLKTWTLYGGIAHTWPLYQNTTEITL